MYRMILVPLDGSPLAERALPFAQALALASHCRLFLLRAALAHALPGSDPAEVQLGVVREAEAYLAAVRARLAAGDSPSDVEAAVFYDQAAAAILEEARFRKADLVVMATHGRSGLGRWLYGSVADHVLRHAEIPVFLVSAACHHTWPVDRPPRVLVPLDGSELAQGALDPAGDLAATLGADLVLLRVVEPPTQPYADGYTYVDYDPAPGLVGARRYLQSVARTLRPPERSVTLRVEVGPAAPTIASVAREQRADLIAMATHGRGGLARLVLGSVAAGVLHQAGVPVLLVRPSLPSRRLPAAIRRPLQSAQK